jgi:hypothetical protein
LGAVFAPIGRYLRELDPTRFAWNAALCEMRHPFAWVCEMEDGALRRMYFYSSHAEALEAAGLSD